MVKAMESNSKSRKESILIKYAIFSRLLVLFLTLLWRSLLQPYDTSATLNPPCLYHKDVVEDSPPLLVANAVSKTLENSVVWDSVYFLRITQCGYEYEQTYAFLPLLPFFISLLSRTAFAPLVPLIGLRAVMVLSGYVVSNLAFVIAAIYLFRTLKHHSELRLCSASIRRPYFIRQYIQKVCMLFSQLEACITCYLTMHRAYEALYQKRRVWLSLQVLVTGFLRCVCICLPFVAFQAYGYYNICHGRKPDELRPWCKARVPLLYNFIQSHYWGVGFLRYFQFKQLPNFLLASPILSLAMCSIMSYMTARPELFISLGFQATEKEKRSAARLYSLKDAVEPDVKTSSHEGNRDIRQRKSSRKKDVSVTSVAVDFVSPKKSGYFSADVFPFVIHLGLMAATAFFIMHVQVATRFLSASPPLYWFASHLVASPKHSKWGYLIWSYCAAYILLGTLLFSNFYPFT
ncbi:GPI mannosyltransferase 2 isoform X2 [Eutrema salsugineum]|uniref:GPI mannosyltransferase 2 isoform X2 n=1 Tax=Eutrema salsugineum TaxID=72664 RepID=UPI000CED6E3A|nr:GPI mannosyltransferase 2 isoform X2 [Eutrema salsugineum]